MDINYCNCAAHGCPMLGRMSRSTSGSAEWFCSIHFGAPAARWGEITHELLRLKWLVDITLTLRAGRYDHAAASKEIKLNQSSHLLQGDHETGNQYLARLEKALAEACKEPAQKDLGGEHA